MHTRGRGRGLLGTWSHQDDLQTGFQNYRAQQVIVNKTHRIVSLSSPPPRLPVTSRLGWIPEKSSPQQNGSGVAPGSQLPQTIVPCAGTPKPRTPCKNIVDSSPSLLSGEPLMVKSQSKPRLLKLMPVEKDLVQPSQRTIWANKGNEHEYLHDSAIESFVQVLDDKEDFTNDDPMNCFSDTSPTARSTQQQSLDMKVSHLLDSIEEHTLRSTENNEKRRDLEEGECEESLDFNSRMVKYCRDIEDAHTFVPGSATSDYTDANQSSSKVPSREHPECTLSSKQALENVHRKNGESAQKPNQAASQSIEEKKIIKLASSHQSKINIPPSELSKKECEERSSQESSSSKQSYNSDPFHGSEDKKSSGNSKKKHELKSEDIEWRREVRIVERRESSRDNQSNLSRERELRQINRSVSKNRSRSPRRRYLHRSSPIRRRSRSRSLVRRRSRSRTPPYRRGRSRSRSRFSPFYQWRPRSRSPSRQRSRSPICRGPRSPTRRANSSRSPCRRSRDRSPYDSHTTLFERKVVVRNSRSSSRQRTRNPRSHSHSPVPGRSVRKEFQAIQNGAGAAVPTPAVPQHSVSTTPAVSGAPSNVIPPGYAGLTAWAPPHVAKSYTSALPQQPVSAHPMMLPQTINLAGYYGQHAPAPIGAQERYVMQQISPHELLHQQAVMQQMIQRQQLQEHLQQQFLQYHYSGRQRQQPLQSQAGQDVPAITPASSVANTNQSMVTINSASEQSSAVAAQKDEVAVLEQRLRAQRDSKLEKQHNLLHQLLIVRFQQADSELKQKIATTEVERERLSLNIMEKAKLEKEMASSAQALEKFIQRATVQLGEDLEEVKKEKTNYLYRFYDPQQHWCELCDVVCEKLHDYLNHLHSKEHEQRLESTGVPSMPWHNKQKTTENEKTTAKDGLIANRIPFGGLQCLRPVKAWYCEMCDVWMGDIHCAQLHMTSNQHNNSFLKRIMERPDSGFFHALKKQAALKKNLAHANEEEKTRVSTGLVNARKMEELLEARKKKKMDTFEKKKKETGEEQGKIREENQDSPTELGKDDSSQKLSSANDCSGSGDSIKILSGISLLSSGPTLAVDILQCEEKPGTPLPQNCLARSETVEVNPSDSNHFEKEKGVFESKTLGASFDECLKEVRDSRTNGNEEFDSNAAPVSEIASSEACEEMPLDGVEANLELSLESNFSSGDSETKESLNVQSHLVDEFSGEPLNAEIEAQSKLERVTDYQTGCQMEDQEGEHSVQLVPCFVPREDDQHSSSRNNSANSPVDLHTASAFESQRNNSDPRLHEDQTVSRTRTEEIDDTAESTGLFSSISQRIDAPENLETWNSIESTLVQPLSSISVKIEPEELRFVKTERNFPANPEGPVVLVKSEHHFSSSRVESSLVGSLGHFPKEINVIIKKESDIKNETMSSGDDEDLQQQTERRCSSSSGVDNVSEQQDGYGTDDCCIIEEVDSRSSRVLDIVDLEVNVVAPTPRGKEDSDFNSHDSDQPDDTLVSEVCVQLSDYIVLSETGEQDYAELD